jgi:hypothetical protein
MLTVIPVLELLKLAPVTFLKKLSFCRRHSALLFWELTTLKAINHSVRRIEYLASLSCCPVTEIEHTKMAGEAITVYPFQCVP